jgi:type II secretory pathway predicted ATPase ExeA
VGESVFLEYYGLSEQPFGVTPDPRFLYLGNAHREALASLICATEANRGFLTLIAAPGTGKTSLLLQFLELLLDRARTVYVFRTDCDFRVLFRQIMKDLGVSGNETDLHEALNQILLEESRCGRRFVAVIDEAQNLSEEALESVRLLSNFETPTRKLIQIVLSGQPELANRLARKSMVQFRQRISSIIRLAPLTPEETNAYIDHRLRVAGYQGGQLLTAGARQLIVEKSEGIPRNINNLCFNAMCLGYALDKKQIDAKVMSEVIADLSIECLTQTAGPAGQDSDGYPAGHIPSRFSSRGWRTYFRQKANSAIAVTCAAAVLGISLGVARNAKNPHELRPATEASRSSEQNAASNKASLTTRVDPTRSRLGTNGVVSTVVVAQNGTLCEILLTYVGRCDPGTIEDICELNPAIRDPNHIQAGQLLRLPLYGHRNQRTKNSTTTP